MRVFLHTVTIFILHVITTFKNELSDIYHSNANAILESSQAKINMDSAHNGYLDSIEDMLVCKNLENAIKDEKDTVNNDLKRMKSLMYSLRSKDVEDLKAIKKKCDEKKNQYFKAVNKYKSAVRKYNASVREMYKKERVYEDAKQIYEEKCKNCSFLLNSIF